MQSCRNRSGVGDVKGGMGRSRTITFVLAALAGLTACSASGFGEADDASSDSGAMEEPAATSRSAGDSADTAAESASGESATAPSLSPSTLGSLGQQLAVVAGVTIATPDVRQAVDDTLAAVARRGGLVHSADVRLDPNDDPDIGVGGWASIVVRIEPAGLEPLIDELDGRAGTLIGRTQESDDVTDQLTDLDIRIRVERNTIARYEELLTAATEFDDIVALERVITERTVELERLLAAERNLEGRVALSTLTIELRHVPAEAADLAATPADDDGIADAFAHGWEAFVGGLFVIAFVAAVVAPFVATAAVIVLAVWLVARQRRRSDDGRPASSPSTRHQHEVVDTTVGKSERRTHAGVGDDQGQR